MNREHDPLRQIDLLQQSLSQNKRPLGFLLGAGCPAAIKVDIGNMKLPLIPDIEKLTIAVCDKISSRKECSAQLKAVSEQCSKDGCNNPNIEDILSHIRGLRAVAGKDTIRGLSALELDQLDDEICNVINDLVDKSLPDSSTAYHRMAAWIDATEREMPVEIFTMNYDLLTEQALEELRVPYFDGFSGARQSFFDIRAMEQDTLPARWARLWKLHGSINWYQDPSMGVIRGVPRGQHKKRVIHPSHLKYDQSRKMPYFAMTDRLRAFLRQPSSVLVICGYSFRDDHINAELIQGLQSNSTAISFAILYGELNKYEKAISLCNERSNLSLLGADEGIIGTRRAPWLTFSADQQVGIDNSWIELVDATSCNDQSIKKSKLLLGDFKIFGDFLQELIGSNIDEQKTENAK